MLVSKVATADHHQHHHHHQSHRNHRHHHHHPLLQYQSNPGFDCSSCRPGCWPQCLQIAEVIIIAAIAFLMLQYLHHSEGHYCSLRGLQPVPASQLNAQPGSLMVEVLELLILAVQKPWTINTINPKSP